MTTNVVSNITPDIFVGITDHLDPQVRAMLAAKKSRSLGGIKLHLADAFDEGKLKQNFNRYFVGYGHKSVGQLGFTDIYLEGVSQIAAKAIENNPLFNGQESSTRYITFDTQPMVHFGNKDIEYWQEKFRDFYLRVLPATIDMLKTLYPFVSQQDGKIADEKEWERTIKAQAFDRCRGVLPAGVTTDVVYIGNFDNINDHFSEYSYHPSPEISNISSKLLYALQEKYPYATDPGKNIARAAYVSSDPEYFYNSPVDDDRSEDGITYDLQMFASGVKSIDGRFVEELRYYLNDRKMYEKAPRLLSGRFQFEFKNVIDFGSYRDIHRHRNGYINMPLLTTEYGFNEFYFNSIEPSFKSELNTLLSDFQAWYNVASQNTSRVLLQYAVPMGYNVPLYYKCDLNQLIYIMERRSGKDVHQTLRMVIHDCFNRFQGLMEQIGITVTPENIAVDTDHDNFTLKRGTQTFVE